MTHIKDLAKSLEDLKKEMLKQFSHGVVSEYYHGVIEVNYDDPDQVQHVIRTLMALREVSRLVSATLEELGSSMRTAGDCLDEIAETRELVYPQATGDQLKLSDAQIEAAREVVQSSITRMSEYRQALLGIRNEGGL